MFPMVVSPAKKKVVKEDSPRPQKKATSEEAAAEASEEAAAEASEEDIADAMREGFETCLKEIKYLSERVEAVEKKSESVNGTNAGRKSLAEDKGPDVPAAVPANGSSSKDKAPEPSLQSPYTANSTTRELADWLKTCPHYRTTLDKKPLVYVEDLPRMCFLDHLFAQQWRFNFKDFKDSEPDQNGLGRRLPVNFTDTHWIAMWISIPKRHIVVFDSICSSISPEELDVVMEPLLYMVPYLLVECASSDEQRAQYSLVPFTYERPTNIPPARAGDCGVYTLKERPSQICLVVQFDKEVKLVR
ncbi:BnaC07g03420D [Brassica napus]|uniref:BnaC07g03420D protein n=1 Tax=Brassica napus TaxID=3708 RepID=A0A078GFA9_BRANA|nr:BnaC07g03420D [Brassica napus]